jgi:chromosome partitioning protein
MANGVRVMMAVNRKGGAGKSTLVKGLASAAADRGESVTIFDTDASQSTFQWMQTAKERGNWSPAVEVIAARDAETVLATIEEIHEQPDQEHLILIDTFGGGSPAIDEMALASHVLAVPAMQSRTDVTEAMATLLWHGRLRTRVEDPGSVPPIRVVLNRVANRLSEPDRVAIAEILRTMPALDEFVMNRAAYGRLDLEGLLGPLRDGIANRGVAAHLGTALEELGDVLDRLDALIAEGWV